MAAINDDGAELDIRELQGKQDKIRDLMRRDPRFIGRLITQLDKQMHGMLHEKHKRQEQIKADQAALDRIVETIRTNIQPCLSRLDAEIKHKTQLKQQVEQQLQQDMQRFKDMEREAQAIIAKARHANSKLMAKTAQAALQEARGFTATIPTTELLRGGKKATTAVGAATVLPAAAAAAATGNQIH